MGWLCPPERGMSRGSLRNQCRGRSYWAEDSAGAQGSRTHSRPSKSKTAPGIHGRKSVGNIMAGQRLQMPRKLLVPAVLAMGTAISERHTCGNRPPLRAIHRQLREAGHLLLGQVYGQAGPWGSLLPLPPTPCRGTRRAHGQRLARERMLPSPVRQASRAASRESAGIAPGRDRQCCGSSRGGVQSPGMQHPPCATGPRLESMPVPQEARVRSQGRKTWHQLSQALFASCLVFLQIYCCSCTLTAEQRHNKET